MYKLELLHLVILVAIQVHKMKKTGKQKKQQRRMICWVRQGGLCYYCRVPTTLPTLNVGHPTDTTATLEHLRDRFDTSRGVDNGREHTVMACHKCNHTRGLIRNNCKRKKY